MATGNLADEIILLQTTNTGTHGERPDLRNLTDPIENWIHSREGGLVLSHEWSGTSLRVQNQDSTWGGFVDLVGRRCVLR